MCAFCGFYYTSEELIQQDFQCQHTNLFAVQYLLKDCSRGEPTPRAGLAGKLSHFGLGGKAKLVGVSTKKQCHNSCDFALKRPVSDTSLSSRVHVAMLALASIFEHGTSR